MRNIPVGNQFAGVDSFHRVSLYNKRDEGGGRIESQTVEANLLLCILVELRAIRAAVSGNHD